MYRADEPFLVAVFKMGGQFYYVWDIMAATEGYNLASLETYQQKARFRLSRNIDWRPSVVGALPLQPRDGTGPVFYD